MAPAADALNTRHLTKEGTVSPTPLQAFSGVAKANANQHTHKRTIVDGEKMTGAQALVRSLEDLGVKVVFGIPGTNRRQAMRRRVTPWPPARWACASSRQARAPRT